jgi:hypothetical protein
MEQLTIMQSFYEQKMKEAYVQKMRQKAEEKKQAAQDKVSSA